MSTSAEHDPDAAFARFRRTGDPDALAAVYDALAPGLLRLAARLLGDAAAAEDALQATFVTAMENAERHDGSRPVQAWLAGILSNHVRNQRRKSARWTDPRRLPSEGTAPDPLAHAEGVELEAILHRHVGDLPEAWQEPILLRVRHGLTAREIASRLQRPAGTIRAQITRGLARLRESLGTTLGALAFWRGERSQAIPAPTARPAPLPVSILLLGGLAVIPSLLLISVLVSGSPEPMAAPVAATTPTVAVVHELLAPLEPPASQPVTLLAIPTEPTASAQPAGPDPTAEPDVDVPDPLGPLTFALRDERGVACTTAIAEIWADRAAYDVGADPIRQPDVNPDGHVTVTLAGDELLAARQGPLRSRGVVRQQARQPSATRPMVLELQRPCVLEGLVVTADGTPAAGARVALHHPGSSLALGTERVPQDLVADAQGRFRAFVHGDAWWHLTPTLDGRRGEAIAKQTEPGETYTFELSLPPASQVSGRVLSPQGQPVSEATVHLWHQRPGEELTLGELFDLGNTGARQWTRSDEDGRYQFTLRSAGRHGLIASFDGVAPADVVEFDVGPDAGALTQDLQLRAGASISGRIVDERGEPLRDLRVVTAHDPNASQYPAPNHGERYGDAHDTTDAEGGFELRNLHPDGRFGLDLRRPGVSRPLAELARDVAAGTRDLRLVVARDALRTVALHGRILDPHGEPVGRVEIGIVRRSGPDRSSQTRQIVTTDDEGRYRIADLLQGEEVGVLARALTDELMPSLGDVSSDRYWPDHDLPPTWVAWFELDRTDTELDLRLPAPGRLRVTILGVDGEPLPHARVSIREAEIRPELFHRGGPSSADENGIWEIGGLEPRAYRLFVSGPGLDAERVVEAIEGKTVEVEIRP